MSADSDPVVLTAKGAAQFLQMPLRTLRYRISLGDGPPCYKLGSQYRFLRSELLDWLRSRPVSVPGVREGP
jgi:predicted DNA-binding transcriptional regulator AlpA